MKTKSEIMKKAHKIAKTLEGDYAARMSASLKIVYKADLFSDKNVETIESLLNDNIYCMFISEVVAFLSKGFQSQIASNYLEKGWKLSYKQRWAVAYEFKNIA
jgi:hypothetical protein